MKWDVEVTTSGEQYYSHSESLTDETNTVTGLAYLLPKYSLLDGNYNNTPMIINANENGYISDVLSDANGVFVDPPVIRVKYDRVKTTQGIKFIFNPVSGDYVSKLKIWFLRDGVAVARHEFEPNDVEYLCEARVGLHDEFIVTFLETSRPYRYVWLGRLQNAKLTDAGGLKIVYEDIALGAKENAVYSASDGGRIDDLTQDYEFPNVAFNLPKYALLNGSYVNMESIPPSGYISKEVSNEDGIFENPPVLKAVWSEYHSCAGITLKFNDLSEDYCTELEVEWYRDGYLISNETFYPNSVEYFCYKPVEYFDEVRIIFKKTSRPFRYAFITSVMYGLRRIFGADEAKEVDCNLEVSPISEELSINTLNFTIRSKSDYAFNFQTKQLLKLYFDEALIGNFYLNKGKRVSTTDYTVESEDAVGLLDKTDFMGGIYNNVLAVDIINAILSGEEFEYFIDEAFSQVRLSGYLPILTKREALAQVAFAIGAEVNTAYDERMYIYPPKTDVTAEFNTSNTFMGLSVDYDETVTGVKVTAHKYTQGTESVQIYQGTVSGTTLVTFSEPYYGLTISGGNIVSYGDNYAYISGTGAQITLTGKKYDHETQVYEYNNPNILKNRNIIAVEEATLVTSDNVWDVVQRVYDYYADNESVSASVMVSEEEIGEVAEIDTDFDGKKVGNITKMSLRFTSRMFAEVTIR